MAQELKGHVIDDDGFEIEVWVGFGPDGLTPDHVYLMYEGQQQEDFPFNNPTRDCELSQLAQRVAAGEVKRLATNPDAVIDLDDVTWH